MFFISSLSCSAQSVYGVLSFMFRGLCTSRVYLDCTATFSQHKIFTSRLEKDGVIFLQKTLSFPCAWQILFYLKKPNPVYLGSEQHCILLNIYNY